MQKRLSATAGIVLRLPYAVNQARMRMGAASLAKMWWRPLHGFAP
jgi:hypothetical protein